MPAKVGIKSCRCASEHARRCVYCVCSYVAAYVGVHKIIIDDSIGIAIWHTSIQMYTYRLWLFDGS